MDLTLAGESLLVRARALLADLDSAINETRSVGGELAGRMALLWEPWVHAYGEDGDVDEVRAAVEELHGRFAPPPGSRSPRRSLAECRRYASRLVNHVM